MRRSAEALKGLGYALAVCHANAVVSDYVHGDADEVTGLLPDEVSLRLDDPWQGGGVWRAEHPGSIYARVEVTQPLGLGWRSSLPVQTPRRPTWGCLPSRDLTRRQQSPPGADARAGAECSRMPKSLTTTDTAVGHRQPGQLGHSHCA